MNNKLLISRIKKRQLTLNISTENISTLLSMPIKDINSLFNEKEFHSNTFL